MKQDKKLSFKGKLDQVLVHYYGWWALILVILLLSLGWFLLLGPQYNILRESGILQYTSLQNKLSEKKTYLADLKLMQLEYEGLDWREVRNVDLILPQEDELEVLFWQIEQIVTNNDLELLGMNINREDDSEEKTIEELEDETPVTIEKVSLTLSLKGGNSYEDLQKLLEVLENNIQILNIKSLTYLGGGENYALTLETYYLK